MQTPNGNIILFTLCFGPINDPVVQKLTLVDPNGPLVPGMSMEFLVVPHLHLGAAVK